VKSVSERVKMGFAWLDRSWPTGWRSKIDVDTLQFANPDKGPLGQLFGDYITGLKKLKIVGGADHLGFRSTYRLLGDPEALKNEWAYMLRTHDKWHSCGDSLIRRIKGIQFLISNTAEGVKVSYFKSGQTHEMPNLYQDYGSAKRSVRKFSCNI
jgi:hypothetical protein